ncbi:HET-domain-containing protein, partial [Trematosphaeria pertusa]
MKPSASIYEPLDDVFKSVRLIEVLPPSSDRQICIRMRQAQAPVQYRCLSYTWGDASQESEILVNDQSVRVRYNLYTFLQTAQRRYTEQLLWIDALCINQNDNIEKNHQVQRMGEIFSGAEAVLI